VRKKKVNILQLVTQMELGGAQKVMLQVADGLPREKYNVYAACLYTKNYLNPLTREFDLDVVDFHFKEDRDLPLTQKAYLFITGLRRLYNFLRQNKIQIVQTYTYYANIIGTTIGKVAGVPIIIASQHRLYTSGQQYKFIIDRIWASFITDRIVAVSDAVRTHLMHSSKLITIHNGIALNRHPKSIDIKQKRKELGVQENQIVIGTVGRLNIWKGQKYLLEAMRLVLDNTKDVILLVVGDGNEIENLTNITDRLGINANVKLLGWRTDVVEILKCLDIFVLPSLEEAFSTAILEAMSESKPIIATNVGGNTEAVADGYNGVIVPPRDAESLSKAILSLVYDRNKRIQFGCRSREIVEEKFDLVKIIDEYDRLYESLVKRKLRR